jgi:hypothetical protein
VDRSATGTTIAPGFAGFSYEKSHLAVPLFDAKNGALVTLFTRLGSGVLRIGGVSVDTVSWNGSGPGLITGTIAPADIDRLAGFLRAVGWRVIYGLNFANNAQAQIASEAAYVATALGDRLYGFELGNEPDLYHLNGMRPAAFTYSDFREEWDRYAGAIRALVPGAVLTGPASAFNGREFTEPFAADEAGHLTLLTHHYYRADGGAPTSTIDLLLEPDPYLPGMLKSLNSAASRAGVPQGLRLAEVNSFYGGDDRNVTGAFGTALWAIDFLFTNAANGSSGVNFHGGGEGPGFMPLADDGTRVVEVRPEYYGIFLFAMAATGRLIPTQVASGTLALTAYAVEGLDGSMAIFLVNKDRTRTATVKVQLGASFMAAALTPLTGPSLDSPTGQLLQGSSIAADGTWNPVRPAVVTVSNSELVVTVGSASALLAIAK